MVNQVILIGRAGGTAELSYTNNGNARATFSIVTTKKWTDRATGRLREDTQWHRIVVWGRQAEYVSDKLEKGMMVYVEGELRTRSYGRECKREITEVNAYKVILWPKQEKKDKSALKSSRVSQEAPQNPIQPEDVPF